MPNIDSQITALQYNLGALYSLLGGSSEERQRFFEIHKGITIVGRPSSGWPRSSSRSTTRSSETQVSVQSVLKSVGAEAQLLER